MVGSSGHPPGPTSIFGGGLAVGAELLVDGSAQTQEQGMMAETSSVSCCGFEQSVAVKQRSRMLFSVEFGGVDVFV